MFVSTLSLRCRFSGHITGMLSEDSEKLELVIDQVSNLISKSAKNGINSIEHHNALWTATAMLISYKGNVFFSTF